MKIPCKIILFLNFGGQIKIQEKVKAKSELLGKNLRGKGLLPLTFLKKP